MVLSLFQFNRGDYMATNSLLLFEVFFTNQIEFNMEIQLNNSKIIPEATVSGAYGHGWETLKKYFPEMLLIFLIQVLLSLPMAAGQYYFKYDDFGELYSALINIIYGLVVMTPVSYGASWVYLKACRGEQFRVSDIFFAVQQFGNVLIASILVAVIVGAGILLLIVPGIIFACKLAFVPYLVMDEKMEAVEAVRKSWSMTRGFAGNIFLIGFTAIFIGLLGLICLIIGIIPAVMWISLAFTSMYLAVSARIVSEKHDVTKPD
jgi:uncharacterized membrane protein